MKTIGLTGSIAMGKTTAAQMFADEGVPVFDADAEVHALYARGGDAVEPLRTLAPEAIVDGAVDRSILSQLISQDHSLLSRVERIVHPLVRDQRAEFMAAAEEAGADFVLLDIPLLLEGGSKDVDIVVVVSAPADTQRARALARPGMTEEKFESILVRQIPDAKKRSLADYVIETGSGMDAAQAQVRDILKTLRERNSNA